MIAVLACNSGELTSSLRNGGVAGSTSSNIPATIVIAPPTSPVLTIGTSVNLVVTVRDAAGQSLNSVVVVWTSSDTTVATVSATGVVSGRNAGIVAITAAAGGVSSSITITVMPIPVNAVSVIVPTAFFVGDSVAAVALPVDASGTVLSGRTIAWSSRNTNVATVSAVGVVIGTGVGTTKIDAIVGGVLGTATVVVSVAPSSVTSVSVALNSPIVTVGASTQANAVVKDSAGNVLGGRQLLWTSSNPLVATVSPLGVVSAITLGNVVISASSGGVSGSAPLSVGSTSAQPVATIAISTIVPTVSPGQSTTVLAVPRDAAGNVLVGPSFTWSSSAPNLATVAGGVITGVAPGTVQISAASNGKTGILSMNVGAITTQAPATITVLADLNNPDTLSLGDVVQAQATLRNAGGTVITTVAPTTWSTSNATVATVNSIGIVSAVSLGTATITATNNGTTGSVGVTVIPPPVKTITISVGSASLITGRTTQATAVLRDTLGNVLTGRQLAWSHVTPAVAQVNSVTGVVTAIGPGSGAIVATSEGRTSTVLIAVTQPPIASITLSNAVPTLLLGQTTQLTALILDVNGNAVPNALVAWSSNAPTKATVSQTGVVTNVGAGLAGAVTISVTTGAVTGTISVNMIGHPIETAAALPQVYLNTIAPPAPDVGGTIINVNAGGNLQAAINAAQPGDVIALANGATFTGNFTLPNKNLASTKWITIRPQNMSGVPAEGSRMTKSVAAAANLPIIRTTNGQGAISTAAFAHHYRLIGLEVTVFAAVSVENFGLVLLGDGSQAQNSLAMVPHDLVLDRMYIHGTTTNEVRRCVALNSASSAVIDSYLSDCHETQSDSQALMGWNGPGPFKIVNNYLEGAAENILFGGSDPAIPNLIPSDIEIRQNHINKPTSWKGVWLIKNHFELKNSQRVLFEGNLLENNWLSGQTGVSVALKSVNQNCTAAWQVTQDVTVRYNLIRNVGGGMSLAGAPDTCQVVTTHGRRFTITDNVITNINTVLFDGDGDGFQLHDDVTDVIVAHNTAISYTRSGVILFPPGPTIRVNIRDNVFSGSVYGLLGASTAPGSGSITTYMPTGTYLANVVVLPSSSGYPGSNLYPTTIGAVGLANVAASDYHITPSSAFKARASDGRDAGADIDMINTLLVNVVVP